MSDYKRKTCISCGAPLPEGAAFCPACTTTQIDRQDAALPARTGHRTRTALWTALALALLTAAVLWGVHSRQDTTATATRNAELAKLAETDPCLAACQTYYTGEDGREYHLFTALTPGDYTSTVPVGYYATLIPEDGTDDSPTTVIVQDAITQQFASESFSQLLESWDVTVNAAAGVGRVGLWEVDDEEESTNSPALLYRRMRADPTCSHNEVVWTLRMKNGDQLTLTQTVEFFQQEERFYHYNDTPLDTAADLQALLDTIAAECSADALVTVQLPETTYDQPITVPCSVQLVGTGTVFAAPVRVAALEDTELSYAYVRFQQCSFIGNGEGTGLTAGAPTYFEGCSLTGWETGGEAVDGGWLYLRDSYIGENTVGVRYSSAFSSSYTYSIRRISFVGNGTALELIRLPQNVYVELDKCSFHNNGADLSNPNGYTVITTDE